MQKILQNILKIALRTLYPTEHATGAHYVWTWVTPILDFESGKKIKFFSESGIFYIAYNVKRTPVYLTKPH